MRAIAEGMCWCTAPTTSLSIWWTFEEAAIDPHVTTIQINLYRVAKNSQVINALVNAARNGKRVEVIVELAARFDEKHNLVPTCCRRRVPSCASAFPT